MPFVGLAFGVVAQQKAESSPHALQTCFTASCAPLPVPTTSTVDWQPGQRCFSPGVTSLMCPFSVVTLSTTTYLHLAHAMAMVSPGLSSPACAGVLM